MQSLPPALAAFSAYRQFMLYKKVPRPGTNKTDKFPASVSGQIVDAHSTLYWVSAEEACAAATSWGEPYGVGFVFTEQDPFWFIDIDDCLEPDNTWSPIALELCGRFNGAAVEVSQSGRGLHIFGAGTIPEGPRRKKSSVGFDLYSELRFAALTGTGALGDASTDHTAALHALVAQYLFIEPGLHAVPDDGPRDDWDGPEDDAELVARMRRQRMSVASAFGAPKATPQQLLDAEPEPLGAAFPPDQGGNGWDESRADASLAQHLAFWTGCDMARMERIMRDSALARDKWDDRPGYLETTIRKACEKQRDVYHAKRSELPPAPHPAPTAAEPAPASAADVLPGVTNVEFDPFLPAHLQKELFEGCVYVMDRHQVFTKHGLIDQGRFRAMYGGYTFPLTLDNSRVTRNAWEVVTESHAIRFPKVTGSCFRPELPAGAIVNEGGQTRVNTYRPIHTRRIEGDPSPFLSLLERILPVERDRRIILTYMASMVQNIGRKFQWWPVIQGAEGNGKSFLANCIKHAVGDLYSFAPNVSDIAKAGNKFNGWLDGRLFVSMEEVHVPERRTFLEDFKTTITNEWLPMESKGVDQVMGDNRANGMMFTNHQNGVPVTIDNRRYSVFFCAQQFASDLTRDGLDGGFFPDLYDWAKGRGAWENQGPGFGYAVIHDFLARFELDPEFDPAGRAQRAPQTSSTKQAVEVSRGAVEQQILEIIEQERQGFRDGWVSSIYLDALLDELRVSSKFPQTKRRELMQSLGFDWHPALDQGRVNNPVLPDNSKPRLYVRKHGPHWALDTPADVARAYSSAQMLTVPS